MPVYAPLGMNLLSKTTAKDLVETITFRGYNGPDDIFLKANNDSLNTLNEIQKKKVENNHGEDTLSG